MGVNCALFCWFLIDREPDEPLLDPRKRNQRRWMYVALALLLVGNAIRYRMKGGRTLGMVEVASPWAGCTEADA
jgi:hypothetical protein